MSGPRSPLMLLTFVSFLLWQFSEFSLSHDKSPLQLLLIGISCRFLFIQSFYVSSLFHFLMPWYLSTVTCTTLIHPSQTFFISFFAKNFTNFFIEISLLFLSPSKISRYLINYFYFLGFALLSYCLCFVRPQKILSCGKVLWVQLLDSTAQRSLIKCFCCWTHERCRIASRQKKKAEFLWWEKQFARE